MDFGKVKETTEQKQARIRSENDNVRSIQNTVQDRTAILSRMRGPRLSILNGKTRTGAGLL